MRVLIADKFEQSGLDGLVALGCEVLYDPDLSGEALGSRLGESGAELLIVRSTRVPSDVIARGEKLVCIIRAGAGYDNIDVAAATEKGIAVCNCPGMNAPAVAELTMGLLLSCDRRIAEQTSELRAGRWNKKEYSKVRGLLGRTLGVMGVGAIGREVIVRARAFGMQVVAWSRSLTPEKVMDLKAVFGGSDRASLLRMVAECDAVTVHVAGTPETEGMCDGEFFRAMRPGAYFINTSRGSVVDEQALEAAIREKGLRAGLDVYRGQPGTPQAEWTSRLAVLPGVTCTHHIGASTEQAQQAVADEVLRIVRTHRESGRFINRVNG